MKLSATRARRTALILTLTAAMLGGCASMANAPAKVAEGVLTGPNGMTLYTFDRDTAGSGKSVCNGPCATNWPPLMAAETDKAMGDFSIITRDDGKKQWAQKGKPLYYWAKDAKPGDKTGDGFNKTWQTAKP
jgi:predicted lipoprotein with Yx(FWY)xxD motif